MRSRSLRGLSAWGGLALVWFSLAPHAHAQRETAEQLASPAPPFDANYVVHTIRSGLHLMRQVCERRLRENRTFAGKVVIEFALSDGLTIGDVVVVANDTGDEAFGKEVASMLLEMAWPTVLVGGTVRFQYPFVFQPSH